MAQASTLYGSFFDGRGLRAVRQEGPAALDSQSGGCDVPDVQEVDPCAPEAAEVTEPLLRIVYPGLPPREFSPNSRVHWSRRHAVGLDVGQDMVILMLEQGWSMVPLEHAVVRFKIGLPDKRRRDLDNLIAACKPLLDALTGRVIKDDRIGAVDVEYSWFESPKNPQTIIEVSVRPIAYVATLLLVQTYGSYQMGESAGNAND